MRPEDRDAILRQGVTRVETPRERRRRELLEEDLASSPIRGRPIGLRLRNFTATAESYLASLHGPLPYMARLRDIEAAEAAHEDGLERAWLDLAATVEDAGAFDRAWRATVERWSFDEVNDLIGRHNRWFPTESRLPMDPRTGDFALINGRSYRRAPLDARWALERFPASLPEARRAAQELGAERELSEVAEP